MNNLSVNSVKRVHDESSFQNFSQLRRSLSKAAPRCALAVARPRWVVDYLVGTPGVVLSLNPFHEWRTLAHTPSGPTPTSSPRPN
ncbi:hypothetical protein BN2476_960023 [Paraburkholderia piptadeniae]|uniref:Uncharacterized protein n=1 Tax=Paraburkholderia piptadeniae TaxID=1701573 RepID=A0A1N7SU60_9BURK|nr:hypothetical protein BN2476_960023 [Paraburkholderia piptadeniae]